LNNGAPTGTDDDLQYAEISTHSYFLPDAHLSQRDRDAGCIIVLVKSGTQELGDNILRTL